MGINYKRAYGDQPDYEPNKKADLEANEESKLNSEPKSAISGLEAAEEAHAEKTSKKQKRKHKPSTVSEVFQNKNQGLQEDPTRDNFGSSTDSFAQPKFKLNQRSKQFDLS